MATKRKRRRVYPVYVEPVPAALNFHVAVKVRVDEIGALRPDQAEAFMAGLARVMTARRPAHKAGKDG